MLFKKLSFTMNLINYRMIKYNKKENKYSIINLEYQETTETLNYLKTIYNKHSYNLEEIKLKVEDTELELINSKELEYSIYKYKQLERSKHR